MKRLFQNLGALLFGLLCCGLLFGVTELFFWLNGLNGWVRPRTVMQTFDFKATAHARELLADAPGTIQAQRGCPSCAGGDWGTADHSERAFPRVALETRKSIVRQNGSGEIIYDVAYSLDEYARRKTEPVQTEEPARSVMLLGDSCTYGEGVRDEETFPSVLSRLWSRTQVVNEGVPGGAPNDFLFRLQQQTTPDLCRGLKSAHRIAVFTFLPYMTERMLAPIGVFQPRRPPFVIKKPMYELDSFGGLRLRGSFETARPVLNAIYYLIARSSTYNFNSPFLPPVTDRDYRMIARVLEEIRNELQRKCGVDRFVVATFPGTSSVQNDSVLRELRRAGVETMDFSKVSTNFLIGARSKIAGDGHPGPLTYFLYARLLHEAFTLPPPTESDQIFRDRPPAETAQSPQDAAGRGDAGIVRPPSAQAGSL